MARLLVYAASIVHLDDAPSQSSWDGKPDTAFAKQAEMFSAYVEKAVSAFAGLRESSAEKDVVNAKKPLYVIVGPEWMFRVKHDQLSGFRREEFYGKDHVARYQALGRSLSSRADAQVLLVPGSILWVEEKSDPARDAIVRRTEGYLKRVDMKYGPDRAPDRAEAETTAIDHRRKILDPDRTQKHFGYNEAGIFFDGTQVKTVRKAWNASDFPIFGGEPVDMVYGVGAGTRTVKVAEHDLKTGLAICFDHSRILDYGKTVDLYMLISCSQDLSDKDRMTAKPKGLIVHADCRANWCNDVAAGGENKLTQKPVRMGAVTAAEAVITVGEG